MNTILGLGGICSLITGIKFTKATINAAIEPILSDKAYPWKKIPKLIRASNHKGRKIVAIATEGNLYSGTIKCAYWKNYIFYLGDFPFLLSIFFSFLVFCIFCLILFCIYYFSTSKSSFLQTLSNEYIALSLLLGNC